MDREAVNLKRLNAQLEHIDEMARREPDILELSRPAVSGWGVSEHLDHLLKVLQAVSSFIILAEEKPDGKLNFIGKVVLTTGFIPRGRAQSPKAVRGARANREELQRAVAACRGTLSKIAAPAQRPKYPIFPHPFFGHLTRGQALRFLVVHNQHHFKIIRDILAGT